MEPRQHLKLLFVGDVMLGRLVNDELRHQAAEYVWGDTLPLFRQADWRACNLECVISDRGSPWSRTPKTFHFRSDAKNLAVLKAAGINAVSLANNHTLDFGHGAMRDMLCELDEADIACAGAGRNVAAAAAPAITEIGGCKIGLLSFTDNQPEWEATPGAAGLFFVPTDLQDARAGRLLELVRYTRQRVNLLIVAAHWGGNWGYSPPPKHVEFGHALITAGADVMFGHSAHVFRGIEIRDNRPIIYSAGDFIDDYAVDEDERNDQTFIFILETDGHMLQRLRLYPTIIRNFQARLAQSPEDTEIAQKMTKLCGDLHTSASWNAAEHCLEIGLGQLPARNCQVKESQPKNTVIF
ncbi:MAG: CapA family protein [Verrucomicrobia bacterium]|nr:CapA family protein [Verrucomicrobiota bacterium]